MLDGPDAIAHRMARQALGVAVSVTEDLGPGIGASEEGIVVGDASVGGQADDRAGRIGQVLGPLRIATLAGRDVEVSLGAEGVNEVGRQRQVRDVYEARGGAASCYLFDYDG